GWSDANGRSVCTNCAAGSGGVRNAWLARWRAAPGPGDLYGHPEHGVDWHSRRPGQLRRYPLAGCRGRSHLPGPAADAWSRASYFRNTQIRLEYPVGFVFPDTSEAL